MKPIKLLLATAIMAASTQANALSVGSLFNSGDFTLISDDSGEFLINVDGSTNASGGATVTNGDILFTIVGFNDIGGTTIGSGTVYNELTSFSAVKVLTTTDVDLGPAGTDDQVGSQNIDLYNYTFAALDAGDTAFFDWSTGSILGGLFTFDPTAFGATNDGIFIGGLFEDSAKDFTRDSTVQAGIDSSTNGDLRLTIGLDAANGDALEVVAPINIDQFLSVNPATAIVNTSVGFQFSILSQAWPGLVFDPTLEGGNGGFSRPSVTSQFPIFDNLDWTVRAHDIPEPTSLALLGIGLLGMASRSRKFKA